MISYQVYKLTHFFGIFLVLSALGGMAFAAALGEAAKHPWRKLAGVAHGIGLFLVLLGGFGMLARLGMVSGMPGWVYAKLALWAILGAALVVIKRRAALAHITWAGTVLIALAAGYLALYKPL